MLKNFKPNQKTGIKSKPKITLPKKTGKSLDKEISPKSTKHSTPSSNTPSGKNKGSCKLDKEIKDITAEGQSDSSKDAEEIVKTTDSIKAKILESLKVLKDANMEYINQNQLLHEEVDSFQESFKNVRNEVSEILWESNRSKEELSRIRVIIESPKSRLKEEPILDFDLSPVKLPNEDIMVETLKHLQSEISEMKKKIEINEKELELKSLQNSELRSTVLRLKDSLLTESLTLQGEESHIACSNCLLF
ncbi:hypothetical protein SteCoe_25012 [Stentor coeruleus]|uniref:Uncharacterized protein n=1 Tax=Stentor coeruleus TaxID=5963 RepID=A0A1R2BG79_9CILI|nr:hypothetical protein SteCoe_25012 [Stentor coeruleus]